MHDGLLRSGGDMFVPQEFLRARHRFPEPERMHAVDVHRGGLPRLQAPAGQDLDKPSYRDFGMCSACECEDFAIVRARRGRCRVRCRNCGKEKTAKETPCKT